MHTPGRPGFLGTPAAPVRVAPPRTAAASTGDGDGACGLPHFADGDGAATWQPFWPFIALSRPPALSVLSAFFPP